MHEYVWLHIAALAIGFILDRILGDPQRFPHPIRVIGKLIAVLDKFFMDKVVGKKRSKKLELALGALTVVIVLLCVFFTVVFLFAAAVNIGSAAMIALDAAIVYYGLAGKSLRDECMKVHAALKTGSLAESRKAVSMIVGRDVNALDEKGVARAAVETCAESLSDGVIAPWLFFCFGGPVLGAMYKAINTMDSMIGYRNDRYEYFGRCAAKLDDVVNYLPSRIAGWTTVLAAYVARGVYDPKQALKIFRRDRRNHKSPNSAQTESAFAGALGLRLAGDAYYFGKLVKKPFIGDELRPIETEDIRRACDLADLAAYLCCFTTYAMLIMMASN